MAKNVACDVPGCERPGVHPVERFGEEDVTVHICDRCWDDMCSGATDDYHCCRDDYESNACEMEEP